MQVKKDSKKELKLLISEKESLKQSSALKRQITKRAMDGLFLNKNNC